MNDGMGVSIRRASLALIVMLAALIAITGYWQVALGSRLSSREDNPRLVLAERQIPRGAIQDRNGHPLAVSQRTQDGYVRYYPEPSAAPVVGYYSLRHGLGGVEAAFDSELRGSAGQTQWDRFTDQFLHRVSPGQPVRLTLDVTVQRAADAALGERAGAVVVLSVPEGEVIALVSRPTFDPGTLDRDWEKLRADPSAPLLNRATQGAYQPGAAFQTIVLGELVARGLAHLTDTVSADSPVVLANTTLSCAATPVTGTLAAAYAAGCPAPFDSLANHFDGKSTLEMIRRWQLDTAPSSFELPVHDSGSSLDTLTQTQSVREVILGQAGLVVSPLQMASAIGVVINGGHPGAPPHLTFKPVPTSPTALIPSKVAGTLQSALGGDKWGGQVAFATSGDKRLIWFVGFAPIQSPRWAIVVLLENGDAATCYQIAATTREKLEP